MLIATKFALLTALAALAWPLATFADDNVSPHISWLQCESDDQCVLAPTNGCGILLGVNKKYTDQVHKLQLNCRSSATYPLSFSVKCLNHACTVGAPDKDGVWKSMPQYLTFTD